MRACSLIVSRGDMMPADRPRTIVEKPVVQLSINALGVSSPAADCARFIKFASSVTNGAVRILTTDVFDYTICCTETLPLYQTYSRS
jgi:hypothetical protein